MVPGEEARGAEVPGEEEPIEVFHLEASHRVEVETFRDRACEVEAVAVAQLTSCRRAVAQDRGGLEVRELAKV